MQTFICQICGDAYLGAERPKGCPFCGAREAFIKEGNESNPITEQKIEIGEVSKKNLLATLDLEMRANAIYRCMAGKAKTFEIKALYKRLAKVELEHAEVACKLLKMEMPDISQEACSESEVENFQKTIALEESASSLYAQFAKEATEVPLRIFFIALNQAEMDHIILIKNYL